MKRERSGRARTVPSGLGSLESPGLGPCEEQSLESELRPAQAGSGVTGSGGQAPAPVTGALLPPPAPSCHNTVSVSTSSAQAHSLTGKRADGRTDGQTDAQTHRRTGAQANP